MSIALVIFLSFAFISVMTITNFYIEDMPIRKAKKDFKKILNAKPSPIIMTHKDNELISDYFMRKTEPVKFKSTKEMIEEALPTTPVGCMWSVKRIRTEWWEGMVSVPVSYKTKLQFVSSQDAKPTSNIGFKNKHMILNPDSELWSQVPESGKQHSFHLEIEFIAPDKTDKVTIVIDDSIPVDRMTARIVEQIKQECPRLVAAYINRNDDWDGVYIKNGE